MEKISANIGTRLFYPKNIWGSMNKELFWSKRKSYISASLD